MVVLTSNHSWVTSNEIFCNKKRANFTMSNEWFFATSNFCNRKQANFTTSHEWFFATSNFCNNYTLKKVNVAQKTFFDFADAGVQWLSKIQYFFMKRKLYSIFWTANATNFIDPISKSSYKVLPRKHRLQPYNCRDNASSSSKIYHFTKGNF